MREIGKKYLIFGVLFLISLSVGCTSSDKSQDDLELTPLGDFDFDVDVDPPVVTIDQGGTAAVDVSVKLVRGEPQRVKLTITGWGTVDITSQFDNPTPSAGTGTKLYITASCDTPPDDYLHTVQGEVGTRTSVDSVNLIVTEKSDCTPPTITAPVATTSAPTAPEVTPTISGTSTTCVQQSANTYINTFTGTASGPIGTYVTMAKNFETECDAWGSNCERDDGEPASTNWKKVRIGPITSTYTSLCTEGCEYKEQIYQQEECPRPVRPGS